LCEGRAEQCAVDRIGDIIFSVRELRDGAEGRKRRRQRIKQEIEAVAQDAGIDRRMPCATPAEWRSSAMPMPLARSSTPRMPGARQAPRNGKNWSIPVRHSMRCAPMAGRTRKRPMPRMKALP
jgi:hypothetical protein